MKKLTFIAAGITDVGTEKKINQDGVLYHTENMGEYDAGVFSIADGGGNPDWGELASSLAVSKIETWWQKEFKSCQADEEKMVDSFIHCINRINYELLGLMTQTSIRTCTALSSLLAHKNQGVILHVGNGRIYRIRGGFKHRIEQLTEDPSQSKKAADGKTIQKMVQAHCLGSKEQYSLFHATFGIRKNDVLLICSDGLYKTMNPNQMREIIKNCKNNMESACMQLIEQAKTNGETDNISVIAIKAVK